MEAEVLSTIDDLSGMSRVERREILYGLPKHTVCTLMSDLSYVRKEKFTRSRKPKYGNLPRAMNTDQFERVYAALPHRRFQLVVKELLFSYALRIGELHKLQVVDGGLLQIGTHEDPTKTGGVDYLPVYTDEARLRDAISVAQSYSTDYLRNVIRKAFKRSGVGIVYATSKDGRRLNQFTTHSFRHTAISAFADFVGDHYIYTRFSRHDATSQLGTVAVYRHVSNERLRNLLKECFGGD